VKKILIFLIITTLVIGSLGALSRPIKEDYEIEHFSINFSKIEIKEKNEVISLEIENENSYLIEQGKPIIPIYTKTFTFPSETEIKSVKCIAENIKEKTLTKKLETSPTALQLSKITKTDEKSTTTLTDPYPEKWFNYDVGHGLYENKKSIIVKVEMYPIKYLPLDNRIKFATEVNVEIKYEKPEIQTSSGDQYELLILSPIEYTSQLQSLVSHKNDRGVLTKHVTLQDIYNSVYFPVQGRDDIEKIKYFIKDAYDNWGISNVLIVGGIEQFPSRETHILVGEDDDEIFVTDIYYADIYNGEQEFSSWDTNENDIFGEYNWDGETDDVDLYPDVKIGRLACIDSSQVSVAVNKIINYENNKAYTKDWFTNIVVIGGDTCPDENDDPDEEDIDEGEYLNQAVIDVMEGFNPDIIWGSNNRLSGFSPSGVQNINNGINNGCGFVDFSGHGAPWIWTTYPHNGDRQSLPTPTGRYTNSIISDLENGDKLPIVVCGGCSLGKFSADENCFAWSFVSNPNGGGVASFGATGLGWVYCGKYVTYGLVEGLTLKLFEEYADGAITFGEMWVDAVNNYIGSNNLEEYDYKTLEEWHPFGDPTLSIAADSQKPNTPNAPEGPSSGKIGEELTYTASTTDPENDDLYYLFDWGDDSNQEWLGPYESGEEIEASHTWDSRGNYQVRVKARDEHGKISDWSPPTPISMPKSKSSVNNLLIQRILEMIANNHPLFEKILDYI